MMILNLISEAIYNASDSKVRKYALEKEAEHLSGFYDTLTALAYAKRLKDKLKVYDDNGDFTTYAVSEYRIPANLKVTNLLKVGRIFATTIAQNYLVEMTGYKEKGSTYWKFDEKKVLSPEGLDACYTYIQTTQQWRIGLENMNKIDYTLFDLSCCKKGTKYYQLPGNGLGIEICQAMKFDAGSDFDPEVFSGVVVPTYSEEKLALRLSLSEGVKNEDIGE